MKEWDGRKERKTHFFLGVLWWCPRNLFLVFFSFLSHTSYTVECMELEGKSSFLHYEYRYKFPTDYLGEGKKNHSIDKRKSFLVLIFFHHQWIPNLLSCTCLSLKNCTHSSNLLDSSRSFFKKSSSFEVIYAHLLDLCMEILNLLFMKNDSWAEWLLGHFWKVICGRIWMRIVMNWNFLQISPFLRVSSHSQIGWIF